MTDPLAPGATIGILGGGQLGRMLSVAAARLGFKTCVYEPGGDCPPATSPISTCRRPMTTRARCAASPKASMSSPTSSRTSPPRRWTWSSGWPPCAPAAARWPSARTG